MQIDHRLSSQRWHRHTDAQSMNRWILSIRRRICQILAFSSVVSALLACGGGGTTVSQSIANDTSQPTTKVVAVNFDATVSTATKSAITEVSSPVDTQAPGGSLAVPIGGNAASYVIVATDVKGRIMLAAYSQDTEVTLSSGTTAYALSRIILGTAPSGMTEKEWEAAIRTFPTFSDMETAVKQALADDFPPDEDPKVAAALLHLLVATKDYLVTTQSQAKTERARALVVQNPQVTKPLPFSILTETYSRIPFSIKITNGSAAGSIEVSNATPLYWAISTETKDMKKLPIDSTEGKPRVIDGAAIVEGIGAGAAIIEGVDNWLLQTISAAAGGGAKTVVLPGAPLTGFNLVVEQNRETLSLNLIKTTEGVIGQFLSLLPTSVKCEKSFLKSVLPDDKLATLVNDKSIPAFKDYLKSNSVDWSKAIKDCALATEAKIVARYVAIFWNRINVLLTAIDAADKVEKGLTVLARLNMLDKYSSTRLSFGVCQAVGKSFLGLNTGFTVVNCAKTIEISPFHDAVTGASIEAPSLLLGASLRLAVTAKDFNGDNTLIPSSMAYTGSDVASVAVVVDNDGVVMVTGKKLGRSYVIARDTATSAETFMPFDIVKPVVQSQKYRLSVGEEATVRLTDSLGQTVFSDGVEVQWNSSDESKVRIVGGAFSAPVVRALASTAGATITALFRATNEVIGSTIIVVEPANADDFVFHFGDATNTTPTCFSRRGSDGYSPVKWTFMPGDFDYCTRYVTPAITCVGEGCGFNRFKVATVRYVHTPIYEVIWPGPGTCQADVETMETISTSSPTYPGLNWAPVSNTLNSVLPDGTVYYPSVSSFPIGYYKNIDNVKLLQGATVLSPQCAIVGHSWYLTVRIFDSLRLQYHEEQFTVWLP